MDVAGEEWTLYFPFAAHHGGGPPYLRRGRPPADDGDVAEWVVGLLRSGREDDADGSSADLLNRPETWAAVLDRLEAEQGELDPAVVAAFVEGLGVEDPTNRRPILHKSWDEIEADAAHVRALSRQAARLLGAA